MHEGTMLIILLFVDVLGMAKLNAESVGTLESIARNYCPYNDFCTFNKTSTFVDYTNGMLMPCCLPCSCDESCWVLNTCCPDIPTTRPPGIEVVTCKSTVFEYTGRVNPSATLNGNSFLSDLYQVIGKCPLDYNGDIATLNRCVNATHIRPGTLHDVVIVSDAGNHNRIFMNKYCAECHGVTAIKRWDMDSWACDPPIHEVSLEPSELFNFILTRCNLVSRPPIDLDLYPSSYCRDDFSMYIDTCNVTGEWQVYDADLNRACLFSHNSFFSDMDFFVYRNIFCFICNNANINYTDGTCVPRYSNPTYSGIGFSSILDINIGQPARVDVVDDRCNPVEIHDSFTKVCRRVNCPINSGPYYGEFIPNTRSLHRLIVTVILKLIPEQSEKIENELEQYDRKTLIWDILPNMLSQLGLFKCYEQCNVEARVYVDNTKNYLYSVNVKIVLPTVIGCDLDYLIRWLDQRVQGTNILMPINGKSIGLTVHVDSKTEFETENDTYQHFANGNIIGLYFGSLFRYGIQVCSKSTVMLNGKIFCPYFIINMTDYVRVENHVMLTQKSLALERLSFYSNILPKFVQVVSENGTKGAAICIEDYKQYITNKASTLQQSRNAVILCIITLIVHVIMYMAMNLSRVI